jgi:hypothetical protein
VIGGRPATDTVIPGRYAVSVGNPDIPLSSGWRWALLSDVSELGTGDCDTPPVANILNTGRMIFLGLEYETPQIIIAASSWIPHNMSTSLA